MNILIPAAGAGRRFREAGYSVPKPFIPIGSTTMLDLVIANIMPPGSHHTVVVLRSPDWLRPAGAEVAVRRAPEYSYDIFDLAEVTDGAARTALLAIHGTQMDMDAPLLLANSDQIIDWDIKDFRAFTDGYLNGLVVVFPCPDQNPKWSYAQIKGDRIRRIVEKQPISEWATAGIYWWARTSDFVRSATAMICRDERTNNEFYIAPTYNDLIREGKVIQPYFVRAEQMHGLGTPEDLEAYRKVLKVPEKEKV